MLLGISNLLVTERKDSSLWSFIYSIASFILQFLTIFHSFILMHFYSGTIKKKVSIIGHQNYNYGPGGQHLSTNVGEI